MDMSARRSQYSKCLQSRVWTRPVYARCPGKPKKHKVSWKAGVEHGLNQKGQLPTHSDQ